MDFDLPLISRHKTSQKSLSDIFSPLNHFVDHSITKRHISSQIDLELGFNIKQTEEILQSKAKNLLPESQFDQWGPVLHGGAQTWVGLDFQILQTSYHDLKVMFEIIRPKAGERVVDLGAGYGRIGIFLHHFYPHSEFLGVEIVKERVDEGNRLLRTLGCHNKKLAAIDLDKMGELPEGDIFFIYDFGSVTHIKKVLEMLKHTPRRLLIVRGQIARQIMLKDEEYGEGLKVKKLEDVYIY